MEVWDFPRSVGATAVIVDVAHEHGMTTPAALAGTGLTVADLDEPDLMISAGQELTVIRNLVGHTGDAPGLGAEAGTRITPGMLGILGFALQSCRTIRDVMHIAMRFGYGKFSWVFLEQWRDELPGETHVVHEAGTVPEDVRAFLIERDLACTVSLLPQIYGGPRPVPIATTLTGARGRRFAQLLRPNPVQTGATRNAIILTDELLDLPMPHPDERTMRLCERQCEELLARRSRRTGVAAAVRSEVIRSPTAPPTLTEIAGRRHVAERTLRRQLAAEGTSLSELIDEVRLALANELLVDGGMSVEQTADRLGFATAGSFTRAYKRWTGTTPGRAARELVRR